MADPLSGRQQDAIRRMRVIDGTLAARLGIDVLEIVHAVLLGGRSVVDASRQGGRKASYWRTTFRLALDEIAALLGLATKPYQSGRSPHWLTAKNPKSPAAHR